MSKKVKLLLPCYFSFLVNGAMVLLVGSILPYLIEEANINYSTAGGMLSAFAIGNFLASFINPPLVNKFGRKLTIVCGATLIPISFFVITLIPPVTVIYIMFVLAGIGRGSISIFNNVVVNDNSDGKPAALNLLHTSFAVGAFIAPFLTSMYVNMGINWRAIVYTIIVGSSLSVLAYAFMKLDYNFPVKSDKKGEGQMAFAKSPDFYIMGFLLFLYLGLENCVNGWFVTYFKSTGIMSNTYATNLVSITWVMVMVGRLFTAKISSKVDKAKLIMVYCIASAAFFVLLIATKNLSVITVAIAGLGLFFAGIYPTSIANVGRVLKGSTTGTSMLLAIAALGGIITPKIVGLIADEKGMVAGIMILTVNVVGMLILSITNVVRSRRIEEGMI